jgi:hypothetical protein
VKFGRALVADWADMAARLERTPVDANCAKGLVRLRLEDAADGRPILGDSSALTANDERAVRIRQREENVKVIRFLVHDVDGARTRGQLRRDLQRGLLPSVSSLLLARRLRPLTISLVPREFPSGLQSFFVVDEGAKCEHPERLAQFCPANGESEMAEESAHPTLQRSQAFAVAIE